MVPSPGTLTCTPWECCGGDACVPLAFVVAAAVWEELETVSAAVCTGVEAVRGGVAVCVEEDACLGSGGGLASPRRGQKPALVATELFFVGEEGGVEEAREHGLESFDDLVHADGFAQYRLLAAEGEQSANHRR